MLLMTDDNGLRDSQIGLPYGDHSVLTVYYSPTHTYVCATSPRAGAANFLRALLVQYVRYVACCVDFCASVGNSRGVSDTQHDDYFVSHLITLTTETY